MHCRAGGDAVIDEDYGFAGHLRFGVVATISKLAPLQLPLFLGCNGVDPIGGVTNINLPEAALKQRMLAVATRKVVLADGSKLGRVEVARLCSVADIDLVITGRSADPAVVDALRERDCEVRVVG